MKTLHLTGLYCLLFSTCAIAQLRYPKPEQNFNDWKLIEGNSLDSLRTVLNDDSLFFAEGADYKHYMEFCHLWEPMLFPHGDFLVYDQRIKTYYDSHPLSNVNTVFANTDPWEELGPKSVPSHQTWMSQIGPMEFVNFYEANPQYMLAGSNAGGLFFSDNSGANWVNSGSDTEWERTDCDWAKFNPSDPYYWFASNSNALLATGAMHRKPGSVSSWEVIGDHNDFGYWSLIKNFIIDPNDGNNIFMATTDGLYKSTNALTTTPSDVSWSKCSIPLPSAIDNYFTGLGYTTDLNYRFCNDVEFMPLQTTYDILYATIKFKGTLTGSSDIYAYGYFSSNDAGATWSLIPNHPAISDFTDCNIETSDAYPSFLYCVSFKNTGATYALNGQSHILRFDASSNQWLSILTDANPAFGNGESFGINQINGSVYFSVATGYRKYDYDALNDSYTNGITIAPFWGNSSHHDIEDIVGKPGSSDMWFANHGGLCKLILGVGLSDQSDGLGVAQPNAADYSYDPSYIITGLYHDGSLLTRTNYSATGWDPGWSSFGGGDGEECLIDNEEDQFMYSSGINGSWSRTENRYSYPLAFFSIEPFSNDWNNAGALNKVNPKTFYRTIVSANNTQEIIRSFDKGKYGTNNIISNFNQLLPSLFPLVTNYHIFALFTPYNNPNIILAHIVTRNNPDPKAPWENSRLFRANLAFDSNVNNVINSWVELPLPVNSWIGQIQFDPMNANILYLPFSSSNPNAFDPDGEKMLFRVDYTNPALHTYLQCNSNPALCADLTYNLPNVNASGFAIENGSDGGMYLSTGVGIFYTNNKLIANTTYWSLLGTSLPHISSNTININYQANKIRCNLFGRGFWQHDLYCPPDLTKTETVTYSSDQFIEAENYIYATASVYNPLNVKYRAGGAVELNPGFIADYGSSFTAFIHACNHTGNSFRSTFTSIGDTEYTINKSDFVSSIIVFPNPADDLITIRLNDKILYANVELRDLSGKLVYTNKIGAPEINLSTHKIAEGMYILGIKNDDNCLYSKVLIEHNR